MGVFDDFRSQYAVADDSFDITEINAFGKNDDAAFDLVSQQRKLNDQAYFLYLFTRFEGEVNKAVDDLFTAKGGKDVLWSDRRIWDAVRSRQTHEIPFMTRLQLLIDKGNVQFNDVSQLYRGRNAIAHGGSWQEENLVLEHVIDLLEKAVAAFNRT